MANHMGLMERKDGSHTRRNDFVTHPVSHKEIENIGKNDRKTNLVDCNESKGGLHLERNGFVTNPVNHKQIENSLLMDRKTNHLDCNDESKGGIHPERNEELKPNETEGDGGSCKTELPHNFNLPEYWEETSRGSDAEYSTVLGLEKEISYEIKQLYPDLEYVLITCKKASESQQSSPKPIFIVYSRQFGRTRETSIRDHTVLLKNPFIVDGEGLKVRAYESENNLQPSSKEVLFAKELMQDNSDKLWKEHSNLNAIFISGVKSRKKGETPEKKLCVVLMCSSIGFIPIREKKFPKMLELEGSKIDVDVREGYFQFGAGGNYPTGHSWSIHVPLKMGCCISGEKVPCAGTIGPFVDLGNDKIGFLTCSHVLFDIQDNFLDFSRSPSVQQNVAQPAYTSTGARDPAPCGTIIKALFDPSRTVSIDAAVVEIIDKNRIPQAGHFALKDTQSHKKMGFEKMPKFDSGTASTVTIEDRNRSICKFGAETHQTIGNLELEGLEVRPMVALGLPANPDNKIPMKGQFGVERAEKRSFFESGDSGAGVFVKDQDCTLRCIGMAIGCTSDEIAVVTPIHDILDALDIGNGLKTFPERMDCD